MKLNVALLPPPVLTFGTSSTWNNHAKFILNAPNNAVDRVLIISTAEYPAQEEETKGGRQSRLVGGAAQHPSTLLLCRTVLDPIDDVNQVMRPSDTELDRLAQVCLLSDMSVRFTPQQKYATLLSIRLLLNPPADDNDDEEPSLKGEPKVTKLRVKKHFPSFLAVRVFDYACRVVIDHTGRGGISSGIDIGSLGFHLYDRKMMLMAVIQGDIVTLKAKQLNTINIYASIPENNNCCLVELKYIPQSKIVVCTVTAYNRLYNLNHPGFAQSKLVMDEYADLLRSSSDKISSYSFLDDCEDNNDKDNDVDNDVDVGIKKVRVALSRMTSSVKKECKARGDIFRVPLRINVQSKPKSSIQVRPPPLRGPRGPNPRGARLVRGPRGARPRPRFRMHTYTTVTRNSGRTRGSSPPPANSKRGKGSPPLKNPLNN